MASDKQENVKQQRFDLIKEDPRYRFIRFKGMPLVSGPGTQGFVPLTEEVFSPIMYELVRPAPSRSQILDIMHMLEYTAPDWSHNDRYVAFFDQVWDRETLAFVDQMDYVFQTPVRLNQNTQPVMDFLLQLSKGNEALAHDYLQGIAGMFMMHPPTGIIWFVGDGANGKSSLLKIIHRAFKKHLVSMTTADLEDGRDIPSMRGILGNIVLESSDAHISDTKTYKSIGSREDVRVHAFQKQTGTVIETSFHTIFNANNVPTFSDKTNAIRRRTLTIPFPAPLRRRPGLRKSDVYARIFRRFFLARFADCEGDSGRRQPLPVERRNPGIKSCLRPRREQRRKLRPLLA